MCVNQMIRRISGDKSEKVRENGKKNCTIREVICNKHRISCSLKRNDSKRGSRGK